MVEFDSRESILWSVKMDFIESCACAVVWKLGGLVTMLKSTLQADLEKTGATINKI